MMLINLPRVQLAHTTYFRLATHYRKKPPSKTYFEIIYALPYHPISAIELKCAVILGIA